MNYTIFYLMKKNSKSYDKIVNINTNWKDNIIKKLEKYKRKMSKQ